ncbi:MAG: class I SAM-dependent methyltransferase [Bacteroidota bacterium]
MKNFWNERYSKPEYAYGKSPNDFLQSILLNLEVGSVLFPADGEGRNSVYAASKGWQVDAFDYSVEAKEKALTLAKEMEVSINFEIGDIKDYKWVEEKYDLVGLFYTHVPVEVRKPLFEGSIKTLKKNGKIIFEAFSTDQLKFNSGGPKNIEMLFDEAFLMEKFKESFRIEQLSTLVYRLSEGPFHQGEASVIRLIATKLK